MVAVKKQIFPAICLALSVLSVPALARGPITFGKVEVDVPHARQAERDPRSNRLAPLRESLQQRAAAEAAVLGFDTIPVAEQTGRRGELYLLGAMGPDGGVFYLVPFLGSFAGPDDDDPWTAVRTVNGADKVTACRFMLTAADLPEPGRFARGNELTALFPGADCERQEIDRKVQAEWRASLATAASFA